MSSEEATESMIVGLSLPHEVDASQLLQKARQDSFDFCTTVLPETSQPRPDVMALDAKWWRTSIVGIGNSQLWPAQLDWAWHMTLPAVILPPPPEDDDGLCEYARHVLVACGPAAQHSSQLWIPVPLEAAALQRYQRLLALCEYNRQIGTILFVPPHTTASSQLLPSHLSLIHWAIGCSQLACVALPCSLFLTNKKGFPTLSKTHQLLLAQILVRLGPKVRWLLQGPSTHTSLPGDSGGASGCLPYLQYLQHLRQRDELTGILDSAAAKLERDYLDELQRPLQPLKDHLENSMYETFEKDPVKYQAYEEALYMALQDRVATHKRLTIVVVGAGRGPLVTCALRAYARLSNTDCAIDVFAVEKNPSAIIYLQSLAKWQADWVQHKVKVVEADLRTIDKKQLNDQTADIVVSELLGSFGCNELSPECLDALFQTDICGAETISIPMRYTSHLAPVASVKLYSQAQQQALFPMPDTDGVLGLQRAMETPYVVRSHQASQMAPEVDCWEFVHPSPTLERTRRAVVRFDPDSTLGVAYGNGYGAVDQSLAAQASTTTLPPMAWTLTGFLGTFTADLYYRPKTSEMCRYSTAPTRFSTGMFSWFPLYFALEKPVLVPAGASVEAHMRRCVDEARVWYEWSARVVSSEGNDVAVTNICNPGGRSYHVSLST